MRRERWEVESQGEGESQKIKSIKEKRARKFGPGGRIVVGRVSFGKASKSSVGKLGGNSLSQDHDLRWPFEILVP
jgi:hypothetical protein